MNQNSVIAIPTPIVEHLHGRWRVSATIAGKEVFFESTSRLDSRPEVMACPFVLPAMAQAADLEISGTVGTRFLTNLAFVRDRSLTWWPRLSAIDIRAATGGDPPAGPAAGVFYTGGIDSAYALQQLSARHTGLRYAVFVEGFDIPLADTMRLERAREWLRATTDACGVELIVVRTNLRQHPVFGRVSWEVTHVSALAAVAHALGGSVHTMFVAASDVRPPWGSTPDLDAAWSSAPVAISNFGSELSRLDRVAAIARWPPLRARLRVCWENNSGDLNCGYCEKCLRTRMQLHVSGARDGLDSFPRGLPLRWALRALSEVEHELRDQWADILARLTDPGLQGPVRRLVDGQKEIRWKRDVYRILRTAGRFVRSRRRRAKQTERQPA